MLEVTVSSLGREPDFLTHELSTVTSPAFSEVIIVYRDHDFLGVDPSRFSYNFPFHWMSEVDEAEEALRHRRRFKVFREIRKVRDFRLVLRVDVWDRVGKYTMGVLKQAVTAEGEWEGVENTFSEPLVIYSPRRSGPIFLEDFTAGSPICWVPP